MSLITLQTSSPISWSGRWACPRCVALDVTHHFASFIPDLMVRKVGLPPLRCPGCHSSPCKLHPRSHGQEGGLAPVAFALDVTHHFASFIPDLMVRKVGLPPLVALHKLSGPT